MIDRRNTQQINPSQYVTSSTTEMFTPR